MQDCACTDHGAVDQSRVDLTLRITAEKLKATALPAKSLKPNEAWRENEKAVSEEKRQGHNRKAQMSGDHVISCSREMFWKSLRQRTLLVMMLQKNSASINLWFANGSRTSVRM